MTQGLTTRAAAGWTLLECLLAAAMMATVFAAVVPLMHGAVLAYGAAGPRVLGAQEARLALAHASAALRQARAVTRVTDGESGAAALEFLAHDGTAMTLYRDAGASEIRYGPAAAPALLARHAASLKVRGYAADGTPCQGTFEDPAGVVAVEIELAVADPAGRADPTVLTTRARLVRPPVGVVVSEIMYKVPAALGSTDKNQWLELHNPTASPVDLAGLGVWNRGQKTPDALLADALYSTGSTVLPPGGYALVTDSDSELYREVLRNGDVESLDMNPWKFSNTWWRASGGAASGAWKVVLPAYGWTLMYQDFKIPSDCVRPRLLVRERIAQGWQSAGRVIIRITNRGSTVLVDVYDGRPQWAWTTHEADLSPVINRDARLEIWAYNASSPGEIWIDAAAVYSTRNPNHDYGVLHLWVNRDRITDDFDGGSVFVGTGSRLEEVVVYSRSWGGDGDGATLCRTDPFAPSTEQASWRVGPYAGSPGAPNP